MDDNDIFEIAENEHLDTYIEKTISSREMFADRLSSLLVILNFAVEKNGFESFDPYGIDEPIYTNNSKDEQSLVMKWVHFGLAIKHYSDFLETHELKDVFNKVKNLLLGLSIWRAINSFVALKPVMQVAIGKKRTSAEIMFKAIFDYSNFESACTQLVAQYSNEPKLGELWEKVQRLSQGGKDGVKITHSKTQPRAQSDKEKITKCALKLLSYAHYSYDELIGAVQREVKGENRKKISRTKIKDVLKENGGITQLRKDAKKVQPD